MESWEQNPTPKLSLFSLPTKQDHEQPGMLTPPIHTLASIPFKWEEAPGKPRPNINNHISNTIQAKPKSARCLELPPRLLYEVKVSNLPSPTTVLDGPYLGRALSKRSMSFGKGRSSFSGSSSKSLVSKKVEFGSTRWLGSSKRNNYEVVGVGFDYFSSGDSDCVSGIANVGGSGGTKVKIKMVKRRSSFSSISNKSPNLLASIYESLKQVVPWRRSRTN